MISIKLQTERFLNALLAIMLVFLLISLAKNDSIKNIHFQTSDTSTKLPGHLFIIKK